MRMNLSKRNTGKRILALLLALMIPAGSVCASDAPAPVPEGTAAKETVDPADGGTIEADPQAGIAENGDLKEDTEDNSEGDHPLKKIRRIETSAEVTKLYGEVFTLEAKLTDQPEGEDVESEKGADAKGTSADAGQPAQTPASVTSEQPMQNQPVGMPVQPAQEPAGNTPEQTETNAGTGGAANEAPADGVRLEGEKEEPFDQETVPEDIFRYASAAPGIAVVEQDESGVDRIRAVGIGDTVITVTAPETEEYEKAEARVLLHVILPEDAAPLGNAVINAMSLLPGCNLTAADNVKDGISLKWGKVEGAKGYYLERSTTGKAPWTRIKTAANADDLAYLDPQVTEGDAYYYRLKAFDASGKEGLTGASKKVVRLIAPVISVGLAATGTELKWNRVKGCSGYYVYRREASKNDWTVAAAITQPGEISWRDTAAGNGVTYIYSVRAYKGSSLSDYAGGKSYMRVAAPSVKSFKRKSATKFKLAWKTNPVASGYQIQYAQNGTFIGAKKVTVKKAKTSSRTLSGLSKNKGYYARIRAYKKSGDTTYYSGWSAASNVKKTRKAKATPLTKKKKVFELRAQSGQKMFQYDTLQGSCTDGKFAYYLMYNRKTVNCKIVKVRRSNLEVEQVSGALDVAHGNDMTYDSRKNRLVIVHSTGADPKRLTSVDPKTLGVIESRHVQIPKKLAGGSIADAAGATAFSGVAYSKGRRQYAVLLSHNYNFVVLDGELDPVRYVKAGKKNNYVVQGIDATDDYILVAQSPKTSKQKYNIITVYDWDGNYISRINAKKGYEIESIYHVGSKYYAGFYRSYYKTAYKDVEKTVLVDGKKQKKKVKVKYKEYKRDNYVYQIKGI